VIVPALGLRVRNQNFHGGCAHVPASAIPFHHPPALELSGFEFWPKLIGEWSYYNLAAGSFHTKKL